MQELSSVQHTLGLTHVCAALHDKTGATDAALPFWLISLRPKHDCMYYGECGEKPGGKKTHI